MTNIIRPPEVVYVADLEESDYEDNRELILVRVPEESNSLRRPEQRPTIFTPSPSIDPQRFPQPLIEDGYDSLDYTDLDDSFSHVTAIGSAQPPRATTTSTRHPDKLPHEGEGLVDFLLKQEEASTSRMSPSVASTTRNTRKKREMQPYDSNKSSVPRSSASASQSRNRNSLGRNPQPSSSQGHSLMTQKRLTASDFYSAPPPSTVGNSSRRRLTVTPSFASSIPPLAAPLPSTASNMQMLTQRRKEESTTTQFMRLIPTLIQDSPIDSHKKLSSQERKKAAEDALHIFNSFLGWNSFPERFSPFDPNQLILLREIFEGMPHSLAADIGVTKFTYVHTELKKGAGLSVG